MNLATLSVRNSIHDTGGSPPRLDNAFSPLVYIENLGRRSWKVRSWKFTRYLINDAKINVNKN